MNAHRGSCPPIDRRPPEPGVPRRQLLLAAAGLAVTSSPFAGPLTRFAAGATAADATMTIVVRDGWILSSAD